MLKKIVTAVMLMAITLAAFGCGSKEPALEIETGATVQQEIVQLVNTDLPALAAKRDNAVGIYNAYFKEGAELDSETWKKQLEGEALTSYDEYLDGLNQLVYTNSEVVNLKSLYTKAANSEREAINSVIEAINDLDSAKLDQAQQSIKDSKTYLSMYEEELKSLCDKYGVAVQGSLQPTTEADTKSDKKSETKSDTETGTASDAESGTASDAEEN